MPRDTGLDTLLLLAGEIYDQGDGYWLKIEAWRVTPAPERPHGISYSLTLHGPDNARILGFDNAHAVKSKKRGYRGRRVEFDHVHPYGIRRAMPYEFHSPGQLLTDFFEAVDQALEARRGHR